MTLNIKSLTNGKAWLEATLDTMLGMGINFPLNILLLYIATSLEFSVIMSAAFITGILTVIAIVRKYCIRNFFEKKVATRSN